MKNSKINAKEQTTPDRICFCAQRTFKKCLVGAIMYAGFNITFFYIPAGYMLLTFLVPLAILLEMTHMHTLMLENLMSRFPQHKAIHYRLISMINQPWFSVLQYCMFHFYFRFIAMFEYLGLVLLIGLLLILCWKFFLFGLFMEQMNQLAQQYRENPIEAQKLHDIETEDKVQKIYMKQIRNISNQERLDGKELVLEQIRKKVQIPDLSKLKPEIQDQAFISEALVLCITSLFLDLF